MRTRTRNFPGTDGKASARMMRDVDADEQAAIAAIKELRRAGAISFEAIAFMLGTGANQISRYLNRSASITLTNYLRIARSLGYRCTIERVEDSSEVSLSSLNTVSRRAQDLRASRERG
jgi:transcriptional regulator with XRE-family HTH domain